MKCTAEAGLVVGVTFGSGRRKVGFGFGIGRRKIVKTIGLDLGEEHLRRFFWFYSKTSGGFTWNWSLSSRNSVVVKRDWTMKRANIINLLFHMMPSSQQHVPAKPDHWTFLEEVDAPQWVDLVKEAALMGTQGDDPWFYRCHAHHETSLARITNVSIAGNSSSEEKPGPLKADKSFHGKGFVSKVSKVKPALKATAVKACLGGVQRTSNAGMKEGRRSSRPRVTVMTTSQTWSRNSKKIYSQRPVQKKVIGAGSDSRPAVYEPFYSAGTPKKSYEAKIGHLRRSDRSRSVEEGRKIEQTGIGRRSQGSDQSTTRTVGRISHGSDASRSVFESPKPSRILYRLPSPPNQGRSDISVDEVRSSPSDMMLSCDMSPTPSSSSAESMVSTRPLSGAFIRSDFAIPTREISGKESSTLQPGSSPELRLFALSANRADVEVNEPFVEISSFTALGHDLSSGVGGDSSIANPDWSQQASNPTVKSRKLGPPQRVKQIEKIESSSAKKKGADKSIDNQDARVVLPDKLVGAQATHPILEKLRRSWGSALRVKQRRDEEVAFSDIRSEICCQNSGPVEQKVFSGDLSNRSGSVRPDGDGKYNVTSSVPFSNDKDRSSSTKRDDDAQMQSEVERGDQPGGGATHSSGGRDLRKRRQLSQQPVTGTPVPDTKRNLSLSVPASGKLSKSKSLGAKDVKTLEKSLPTTGKIGLVKIQANHQSLRSKSDVSSKFKKQYLHEHAGILSKSLPMKGNKENMNFQVSAKAQSNSPTGLERKRKMQSSRLRSSTPASVSHPCLAEGVPAAASVMRIIPQARTVGTSKADFGSRPSVIARQEVADSSCKSPELLDKKSNNLAILRGSPSSSVKLSKQKSEKLLPTISKDIATLGTNGCKSGGQVADESVSVTTEDCKSRVAAKYEPRIHSVKAIREWESKSGRRYYDLQPRERLKVNQEITATSKTVTKRSSA